MRNILTIIDKEWAEVFKNRLVIGTVLFMPLIFTALPLITLGVLGTTPDGGAESSDMPASFLQICGNISPADCAQIFLINQFMIIFMMMPLIIPISIAAYSIVGEKTARSLEPLLATPITTEELLAGKSLAAVIPAILATWLGFGVFLIGSLFIGLAPAALLSLFNPTWYVAVGVVGPLMAVMAVNFAIMVSSRVTDPRTAEQLSAVVIMPLMVLVFGQIAGVLIINLTLILASATVLAFIDLGLIYLAARFFRRETILTQWK